MRVFRCLWFFAVIAAGAHAQMPITFSTASPLGDCEVGIGCQYSIRFTGGTPPTGTFDPVYTFTSDFAVPGLVLVRGSGPFVQIGGTPATAGTFTFNITVSDGRGGQAAKMYTMRIAPRLEIITTSPLPDAEEGVPYSQTLVWRGGVEPYRTFQCISNHFAFTCNGQGVFAGRITSVSGQTQTLLCAARLNIVSGIGNMQSRCFDLTVRPGLAVSDTQFATAAAGLPYTHQLTAVRGRAPYAWTAVGTFPSGLTFSSSGLLSGTPTQSGTFQINARVTDANGTLVGRNLSLTITGAPFTITTSSVPAATAGQAYSQQLTSANGQGAVTWAGSGFPTGVALSPSGLISGTATQPGTYTLFLNATDSAGRTATRTLTLSVAAPQPTPIELVGAGGSLTAGTVGSLYAQALLARGGTPPYTFTFTGLPPGIAGSPQGALTGRPTAAGTYTVNVTATDAAGQSMSGQYTIFIAPDAASLTITTTALPGGTGGQSYSQQLTSANGQGAVTWVGTGLPAGVTLSPGGLLSGTPAQAGVYTVAVIATDSAGRTATATLALTVAPGTRPMITSPLNSITTSTGVPVIQRFEARDGTPPYTWRISGGQPPVGLTLSPLGFYTGIATTPGGFTFDVTVTDARGETAAGTYRHTITAASAEPPPMTCAVQPIEAPPTIRQEGATELISDIVIRCTGGTPAPPGEPVPLVNISLNLNTGPNTANLDITTPVVPFAGFNNTTGAVLLIDEPPPDKQVLCGSPLYPFSANTIPRIRGSCGDQPGGNTFFALTSQSTALLWPAVPVLPPGTPGVRLLRITNVRANASQVSVPAGRRTAVSANLQFIPVDPSGSAPPVTNNNQTVAFVQPGLTFSVREPATYGRQTGLAQCPGTSPSPPSTFGMRFVEGFATAFKPRFGENAVGNALPPPPPDRTETGYYVLNPSPDRFPVSIGPADSGTRLTARFNNIPAGGRVFVSLSGLPESTASARLIGGTQSSVVNNIPHSEVPVVNNNGLAIWEIERADPNFTDTLVVSAYATYSPGSALGTASVTGTFDPFKFAGVDRNGRPITGPLPAYLAPEYISDPARGAPAAFTVRDCNVTGALPQAAVTSGALPVSWRLQGNPADPFTFYMLSRGDPITGVTAGSPNVPWLTVQQNTSTTPATFKITVNAADLPPGSYTGSFPVSGNGIPSANFSVPVTVLPPGPHLPRFASTNAGSYIPFASPKTVMTFFGARLGPPDLITGALTPEGKLGTSIGDTRVLFDGVAAPMVYATAGQVSAVAPFSLAGKTFTNIEVEYRGEKSPPVAVPVAPLVPALLTADASGVGKAAALNEDNSPNAVTGGLPGQYVVLFGVGGPETDPAGSDGEINAWQAPFKQPVKVLLDGKEAPASDIAYAGAAPGLVHGVFQINVRLAADAPRNQEQQVQVVFGDVATQPGVTVSVR
jgi:uncharacterized protein (TIGR03437 family)